MQPTDSFYHCPACGRSYKSVSVPARCAVCGAEAGRTEPAQDTSAAAQTNADAQTDKFRLAADRAKGNFR